MRPQPHESLTSGAAAAPRQPDPSLKDRFVERSLEKIIFLHRHPPLRRRDLLMPLAIVLLAAAVWFKPAPRQLVQKIDQLQARLDRIEATRHAVVPAVPPPPTPLP